MTQLLTGTTSLDFSQLEFTTDMTDGSAIRLSEPTVGANGGHYCRGHVVCEKVADSTQEPASRTNRVTLSGSRLDSSAVRMILMEGYMYSS